MTKMLKATNEAIAVNLRNDGDSIEFEAYLDIDTLERYSIPLFVAWKAFAKDTSLKAELLFFGGNPKALRGVETLLERLEGGKNVKVSLETTQDGQILHYAQNQGRGITSINVILANESKVAKIVFGLTGDAERIVTLDKQEFLKAIRELLRE